MAMGDLLGIQAGGGVSQRLTHAQRPTDLEKARVTDITVDIILQAAIESYCPYEIYFETLWMLQSAVGMKARPGTELGSASIMEC